MPTLLSLFLQSKANQYHLNTLHMPGRISTSQVWRRAELRAYTKARTDEILHLNTSIAALKKQLEAFEQEAYALEAKKDQQLQAATRKTLTYGQVNFCVFLANV